MHKINVTKTFLPPIDEYITYLHKIWQSGQVTNQGKLLIEFEKKAKQYLDVRNFHFVTNGTLALQIALKALDIDGGEIITTPFSYVASVSAILWERCDPVFVDINPETFCIDADKIEAAITKKTKAILAVHVYGLPCEIEKIEIIAKAHGLKVIYDGAHAFGVKYNNNSLLSYGDISTCSFHATKPFHTIEGGCIIAKDNEINNKIELIKRFGHHLDDHYMLGINAKASEFQAAMGLCNLKYIDKIIEQRKAVTDQYDVLLAGKFFRPKIKKGTKYNYSYYPLLLDSERQLLRVKSDLEALNIFPRRYFYPSLNTLAYLKKTQRCPIAEDIASRIICLPLYDGLDPKIVETICNVVKR
jgi:dTDP-4-amino-4,6-dideoxygalactose transaminase